MESMIIVVISLTWSLNVLHVDGSYTNKFAVHISGGEERARSIAAENGFRFVTKVNVLLNNSLNF